MDVSNVLGNAPRHVKQIISGPYSYPAGTIGFAKDVGSRLSLSEVSITDEEEFELIAIFELDVKEDMLNMDSHVHGGCFMLLIDYCTAMAIQPHILAATGSPAPAVSQTLSAVHHYPAGLGERLRIICRSGRPVNGIYTAQAEFWSVDHHRVVATGTHVNMKPSRRNDAKSKM
ncbi:hypothetical protein DL96DRAFT_1611820 [Flagelloscypha sp. PMI_526]|nr:hypothetical protein DL96DRAFT_1611820 [Flagelloscypha sp. PMI_526]